jgi:hypothetical protein
MHQCLLVCRYHESEAKSAGDESFVVRWVFDVVAVVDAIADNAWWLVVAPDGQQLSRANTGLVVAVRSP